MLYAAGALERPGKRARISSAASSGAGPNAAPAPASTSATAAAAEAAVTDDSSDREGYSGSELGELWAAGDESSGAPRGSAPRQTETSV